MKRLLGTTSALALIVALIALPPRLAQAATCAVPFTFVNGTAADATQVNANFNALATCIANAVVLSPGSPQTGTVAVTGSIASGTTTITKLGSLAPTDTGVQNDGAAIAGLQLNVPTSSTNGFTFTVNGGLVGFLTRLGVFASYSQVVPGNAMTPGTSGLYGGAVGPNAVITAPNASIYLCYGCGVGQRLWVNTSGASTSGNTWTAVL